MSSLLQICGENEETEPAKDDSQANRTKIKTNELVQSAQRMSRWVQMSNWISKRKCIFTKYTPFFIKNVVFFGQAEYSYFSANFRLKIFLYYFKLKKKEIIMSFLRGLFIFFFARYTIDMYFMYRSSNCH